MGADHPENVAQIVVRQLAAAKLLDIGLTALSEERRAAQARADIEAIVTI